jgi:hypothetical protein
MDPMDIFELIIKADEKLKYATEDKATTRATQARDLLTRARAEAVAIENEPLIEQADRRLADLESLSGPGEVSPPRGAAP